MWRSSASLLKQSLSRRFDEESKCRATIETVMHSGAWWWYQSSNIEKAGLGNQQIF